MKWFKFLTALPSDPQLKRTFRHIDARGAQFDGVSPVAVEKQRTFGAFTLLCCYIGNYGSSREPGVGVQADGTPLPLVDMAAECCFFDEHGNEHVEALVRWLDRCADDDLIDAARWRNERVVSIPYMQGNADEYTQRAVVRRSPDSVGTSPDISGHLPSAPESAGAVPTTPEVSRHVPTSPDMSKKLALDKKRRDQIRSEKIFDLAPEVRTEPPRCAADADATPPSPALLTFPTTGAGPKTWHFTEAERAALAVDYPDVDILAHVRRAHAWVCATPRNRKTASGMRRFLVNWLNRDIARGVLHPAARPRQRPTPVRPGGVAARPDKYAALMAESRAVQDRAAEAEM
jgi:hypothetical protein